MTARRIAVPMIYWTTLALAALAYVLNSESARAEDPLDEINAKFVAIPEENDPCWQPVPTEQIVEKLRFLVDQQNDNFNKIKTWSARYRRTFRQYAFGDPEMDARLDVPQKVREYFGVYNETLEVDYDRKKERLFFAKDLIDQATYTLEGEPLREDEMRSRIMTNLKAVFTPKKMFLYERDSNFPYPEGAEEQFGKMCYITDPERYGFSPIGTFPHPKSFYLTQFGGPETTVFTHWDLLERILIPALSGELGEDKKQQELETLKFQEARSGDVTWYRIERESSNANLGMTLVDRIVYNSASGYNNVRREQLMNGAPSGISWQYEFVKINDVYVPSKALATYPTGGGSRYGSTAEILPNFVYFEMLDGQINQKIPEEKFTLEALELDDSVLIHDTFAKTYYNYEKATDAKIPFMKEGSTERIIPPTPFWKSPMRLVAMALGVALILFGIIMKIRKRSAGA